MLMKQSAEIKGIIVSHKPGYFTYFIIAGFQHMSCKLEPYINKVLQRRNMGIALKFFEERTGAVAKGFNIFFNIDALLIMVVKVRYHRINFISGDRCCIGVIL